MVETRPKRTAALKAESENKRIALAARKPMEAQDLQTQEEHERERPAPHRRAPVQPEDPANETPDRHPANTRAVEGSMSQIQIVNPRASPEQSQRTPATPYSHSRSQSVPGFSDFQQISPQPATPGSRPQTRNTPSSRNSQRSLPPSSSPHLNAQWQSPDAVTKGIIPAEGPQDRSPIPGQLPRLLDRVISSNREMRQQASAQAANVATFLSLAHPQPQNTIHHGFQKASPANRELTKNAEKIMCSQTPPVDADVAQTLGRQTSTEDMVRLGLTNIEPAQRLQHAYYAQRTGTAQMAQQSHQPQQSPRVQLAGMLEPSSGPQQYDAHQPPRMRACSSPPGQLIGITDLSSPVSSQQNTAYIGLMNRSRAVSESFGDARPASTERTILAKSAVAFSHSNDEDAAPNDKVFPILATHPRASSEAPIGAFSLQNRSRAYSAESTLSALPNLSISRPGAAPNLLSINNNVSQPRIKLHFDRNARSRENTPGYSNEQPEDSDATVSPSPRKTPGPSRDSDATVSPSPIKNIGLVNGRVLPPVPLFHQGGELAEVPSQARLSEARPANRQAQVPVHLSDDEPVICQRNLDFQFKSIPNEVDPVRWRQQQEEHASRFERDEVEMNRQQNLSPIGASEAAVGEQQQNIPVRQPGMDQVEARFQVRNYALATAADTTAEENEDLRLSSAFTRMLGNLKLARAADKEKLQDEDQSTRQCSKSFVGCLAVTQLPPAVELSLLHHSQSFHEIMEDDDDDVCVFCNYETCFGVADSRVWLPSEASPGYCNECHEDTQQVFRMWEGPYRLPHGLSQEDREKYKGLIEMSTATPLKELGDNADFKSQQKLERSKPQRQNAILNASKPCAKDARKDRREQRKEYILSNSVRNVANVPRGGKLPQRRAVSGGPTRRNSSSTDIQRVVPDALRGNQDIENSTRNTAHISSRRSAHTSANSNQPVQTACMNGVPSSLPIMSGSIAPGHPMVRPRSNGRVITPNSAAFMSVLDLSAPAGSMATSSKSISATGIPASASPILSNVNISGHTNVTMSTQPTEARSPSGVPIYFNAGPPGSFLRPPPFNSGPSFCRGCPWRQVDFTRAKICTACRDCKFMICSHTHHLNFTLLTDIAGVMNGEHEGHGLGRVTASGRIIADGRYSNCMVCPGQATHGCDECPLRLCAECVVRMTKLCKGKMNELLNFYNTGRDHIRNDAFLLRNDNKGF
ncbi:hypothetical protein IFR04_004463 [Cadophora malorum]|uniref:Uncharacterized protein n=1 Tax=Cadophora malorum TaxID=108018 RepID=A0A8H8BSL8_9HELO|nr:hypothetical protein IFR04_004463 [Cadophora malorum]